ncbi:DUF5590 domain-containing protein [Lactobacillus sp. YT155]|uniref:cell wall elongation regulator TseB-like domain-containing protein n=1 Tax=Lactobacillus sp. YT155 TaxID=3060955 RepID=UPI00265FB7DD|nr:DUF5590 domain-containing protein [Lactobacillus sp. YT155]MDO1605438.1 DUF5590 domain-containing protein [Lactobacillus sp. YT155]
MRRSVKLWIIIGTVVIVLISAFWYFSIAMEPYTSAKEQANRIALKSENIKNPDYFSSFTGKKDYYTVGGTNNKNEYKYVVINAKSGKIKTLNSNEFSRNYILKQVNKKYNPKKIYHINLGLVKNKPTWEVSYLGKNNLTNYVTFNYHTGEIIQEINNI